MKKESKECGKREQLQRFHKSLCEIMQRDLHSHTDQVRDESERRLLLPPPGLVPLLF